jgi:TonB-dependent receptor
MLGKSGWGGYRIMTYRPRTRVFASVLLAATALASAPAWAQTAPESQAADADPSTQVDEIIVTGFRRAQANAIAAKRDEVAITDGISADGLGRFPDLNVGEALQRVPGVQLNREAEGRNATINLRGLPGEFSRLTLNGVAFAEPILRESAPLGAFNSDIFTGIVVNKSPLADAQSGGLSGNVDLQIGGALARADGGFTKAAVEYNELGETTSPAATIGYNHHFTDDFAVFGVLAYRQENFRRDSILFNSYAAFTPAQAQANAGMLGAYYAPSADCPSCTGTASTAGVLYDAQHRQYVRLNEGDLYTGAAGAEWRISDEAKVGITGFYSDRNLPQTAQYLLITSNNLSSADRKHSAGRSGRRSLCGRGLQFRQSRHDLVQPRVQPASEGLGLQPDRRLGE